MKTVNFNADTINIYVGCCGCDSKKSSFRSTTKEINSEENNKVEYSTSLNYLNVKSFVFAGCGWYLGALIPDTIGLRVSLSFVGYLIGIATSDYKYTEIEYNSSHDEYGDSWTYDNNGNRISLEEHERSLKANGYYHQPKPKILSVPKNDETVKLAKKLKKLESKIEESTNANDELLDLRNRYAKIEKALINYSESNKTEVIDAEIINSGYLAN